MCWLSCSPAHLRAQWALCPPSTPQTWNISRHSPELGVSHRAPWNCATGTALVGKPTLPKGKQRQLSVCGGWAQSLLCTLLPWGLARKKMGFLPPGGRDEALLGWFIWGITPEETPRRTRGLLINNTAPSQSQQSCDLLTFYLSQPPKISLSPE